MIEENIITGIISVAISVGLLFTVRFIIKTKLKNLKGTQKLLGLIYLIIIISELVYLGIDFNLFRIASEIVASIGVAFALIAWALQNTLKNTIAGIGIYLNPEIDVGDTIEIDDKKGVIIELHITKITAMTDDGVKMFIPNQKIHEDVTLIYHRKRSQND